MDEPVLDVCLLAAEPHTGRNPANIVAHARYGADIAIEPVTCDALQALQEFRARLRKVTLGAPRPTAAELTDFGRKLFAFSIRGLLQNIYARLPAAKHVRIQLVSNSPPLQALPWEYLRAPSGDAYPDRTRSVVRIVPAIGQTFNPDALPSFDQSKIRLLYVWAEPTGQTQVSWDRVKATIERLFKARVENDHLEIDVVAGASVEGLRRAISAKSYNILHFSGHGTLKDGKGYLLLQGEAKKGAAKPELVSAEDLRVMLQGRGIQLVVLGACDTSAGDFAQGYAVIAYTLLEGGIPAVVANQFPVADTTMVVFTSAMYGELLRSGDIDLAVAEGRVALKLELKFDQHDVPLECGIPTLYRLVNAHRLFKTG